LSDPNPVKNIKIDEWYKVLIPLGSAIIVISFIFSFEEYSKKELLLLGGGLVLIGLGEWKNERHTTQYVTQSAFNPFMRITEKFRRNDKIGVPLEILGLLAVTISLLNIFNIIDVLK
jgi:hypothetical protein